MNARGCTMEIVEKNLISIICGVVALAAIGVGFTMLPGRATALQTKLEERKRAYDTLHSLLSKPRQMPSVNPDNPSQDQLTQFPSARIIEDGQKIMKQVE